MNCTLRTDICNKPYSHGRHVPLHEIAFGSRLRVENQFIEKKTIFVNSYKGTKFNEPYCLSINKIGYDKKKISYNRKNIS